MVGPRGRRPTLLQGSCMHSGAIFEPKNCKTYCPFQALSTVKIVLMILQISAAPFGMLLQFQSEILNEIFFCLANLESQYIEPS